MLGIDTNVLVRLLVKDHPAQFAQALKLIRRELASGSRVCVNLLVIQETEWVLRSRYGVSKRVILDTFSHLLEAADIYFDHEQVIEEALFVWKDTSADFTDCLISAKNRRLGCSGTATFDTKALRSPGYVAVG